MDAPNLDQLLNLNDSAYVEPSGVDQARLDLLREAACSLGARGGLSRRSAEIFLRYEEVASDLSATYNFQSIMLENGVLPPVITKITNTVKQESDVEISFSGVTYTIEKDARLVTTAPSWREYLYKGLSDEKVEPPPKAFFPKNAAERVVWKDEVGRCWALGVRQANEILEYNQSELKRDFRGMLQYKLMALKGDIKVPVVVTKSVGSETDGRQKRVDQRTYTIKRGAGF